MFGKRSVADTIGFMYGNVMVFAITDLLGNFARGLVFPYASLYVLALGGDVTQVGWVNFVAPVAGLVVFPVAGYVSDHVNRVKLIVAGGLYSVLTLLLYVLAPSWQVIAMAGLLSGFGVFLFPAQSSLIADSLSPENRGKGIAWMNTISSTLAIVAPFVAGVVVERYGANTGVRILYGVMLGLYLCGTLIQMRFLKEPRPLPVEHLSLDDLLAVLKAAYRSIPATVKRFPVPLKALTIVVILSFMANGVAGPFWVVFAVEQLGLSPAQWGTILLIESLLKVLLFVPAGLLVDRWGRTRSLLLALILSLVSVPLFVFVQGFAAVLAIRIVAAAAFTLAIPACTALMADIVPREMRGRVMALVGQGGIMLGPAGGGTGGPAMGFLVIVPLMLASLLGGYLYALNPAYPWYFVLVATVAMIVVTGLFVRDPRDAEV